MKSLGCLSPRESDEGMGMHDDERQARGQGWLSELSRSPMPRAGQLAGGGSN